MIKEGIDEGHSDNVYTHVVFIEPETYRAVIRKRTFDNFCCVDGSVKLRTFQQMISTAYSDQQIVVAFVIYYRDDSKQPTR